MNVAVYMLYKVTVAAYQRCGGGYCDIVHPSTTAAELRPRGANGV